MRNHGALQNAPTWQPSQGKIALGFNGTNQSGTVAINLSKLAIITLSYWVYVVSYPGANKLHFEYTPSVNTNNGFIINPNNSPEFVIYLGKASWTANGGYTTTRPAIGKWSHVHIVLNRLTGTAMGVSLAIDGASVTMTQQYFQNLNNNFDNSNLNIMSRNAASQYASDILDDVRIYSGDRMDLAGLLALRRGIAYETERPRRYRSAPASGRRRRIITGGNC